MSHFESFMISICLPAKVAKLRFQQMKKTITYVFAMMFIASIPGVVPYFTPFQAGEAEPVSIVVSIVVYYVFFSFLGFLSVSMLAGIGLLIRNLTHRKGKLPYNQLWIMSAYAITVPVFVFTVAAFLHKNGTFFFPFLILLTTGILLRMIIAVPKPGRKR